MENARLGSTSAPTLQWLVGIGTVLFVIGTAWAISAGKVTPEFLLWADVAMIGTALVGVIIFAISYALGSGAH